MKIIIDLSVNFYDFFNNACSLYTYIPTLFFWKRELLSDFEGFDTVLMEILSGLFLISSGEFENFILCSKIFPGRVFATHA